MSTQVFINNINNINNNNSFELCNDWGWYIDIDNNHSLNKNNKNNKYNSKKNAYIVEIINDNEEHSYYMNQHNIKKYNHNNIIIKKFKTSYLERIDEDEIEEQDEYLYTRDEYKKKVCKKCNLIKITYTAIITGLFVCVILFSS
jgi:hypothetical protein